MDKAIFDAASVSLFLLSVPRLFGLILLGDRDAKGWYFGIGSAVASVGWAMWTHAYALVAVSTVTIFVGLRGAKRWAHREDEYRARFHAANNRLQALELEVALYRSPGASGEELPE